MIFLMDKALFTTNDITKMGEGSLTILTANRRLANYLQQEYDKQQQLKKQNVWKTANILPLNSWIEKFWLENESEHRLLLSDFQESCIWESIIQSSQHKSLLNPFATAQLAKQAWQLINSWNISLEQIDQGYNDEVRAFSDWARQFINRCEQEQWISRATLTKRVIHLLETQSITTLSREYTREYRVAGFDELSPIYNALIKTLSNWAKINEFENPYSTAESIRRLHLTDPETEIRTMASWSKQQNELYPEKIIGCIVPDLNASWSMVEQIFTEIFIDHKNHSETGLGKQSFNISAGKKLNEYEIIRMALFVLALTSTNSWSTGRERKESEISQSTEKERRNGGTINIHYAAQFFQSPYLCANEDDINLGALLDTKCRELQIQNVPLDWIIQPLKKLSQQYTHSTWLSRFEKFLQILDAIPSHQLPSMWANQFCDWLHHFGWPGRRSLNSLEYQLAERWQKLLIEFSSLDYVVGEIALNEAIKFIQRLAAQTLFQPQSEITSIQILGVLEATGYHFDLLWIMGLQDQSWPPNAKPNPFIPYDLQIQLQMPHSSAMRELIYTQQITERLLRSANEIILSSAKQIDDQHLRPSQLIVHIPEISVSDLNLEDKKSYLEIVMESKTIEMREDKQGPEVSPNELIKGGSLIIKYQSLCPFRAFASMRLNANPLVQPVTGISGSLRGTLIHRILNDLWMKIKNHQTLNELSDNQLNEMVESKIHQIFGELKQTTLGYIDEFILEIEKNCLAKLVFDWLVLEKERTSFSVHQLETKRQIKIGELSLALQLDRIDELPDGSQIIIDYKTGMGANTANDWFGQRPKEPQLPLYCVYGDDSQKPFSGIIFANVRTKKKEFRGIVEKEHDDNSKVFSHVIPIQQWKQNDDVQNWQQIMATWKTNLEQLAYDFSFGLATVDPLEDQSTCQQCNLQPLCRIYQDE